MSVLLESNLTSLPLLHRGKVRDIYEVDDERLLIVQTDRLSAFDVILPTPVPGKGQVLTTLSNFWFSKLNHVLPNHLTGIKPESLVATDEERAQLTGRAFVVKRLRPVPIEAIVRGYLAGSAWKEYQKTGMVCGINYLPIYRKRKNCRNPYLHLQPRQQQVNTMKIFPSSRP